MKKSEDAANWAKVYYYGDYKTAIQSVDTKYNGFHIVTRVNYITAKLWLEKRNKVLNNIDGQLKLPDKPNWLVMINSFRRSQDKVITELTLKNN